MKAARGDEMKVDPEYEWTPGMIAGRRTEREADGRARSGTHESLLSTHGPDKRGPLNEGDRSTTAQGRQRKSKVPIGIYDGFSNVQKHGSDVMETVSTRRVHFGPANAGLRAVRVNGGRMSQPDPRWARAGKVSEARLPVAREIQRVTTNVMSSTVESPPSWAWQRNTYVPGSPNFACTTHLPSSGALGVTHPGDHGELPPSL